jgi:hypothetical protein
VVFGRELYGQRRTHVKVLQRHCARIVTCKVPVIIVLIDGTVVMGTFVIVIVRGNIRIQGKMMRICLIQEYMIEVRVMEMNKRTRLTEVKNSENRSEH